MRGSMVSVMPTSRRRAAVSRSDSLNASACVADIERRRLQVAVGVMTGEQLGEVLGLQRLGAIGDVAVAIGGLE
eukprot:309236-Pleurochrysis_carterae.AAC.1